MDKVESLPLWKKIMYALGQFGWSLAIFGASNLINYFYLPPEQGEAIFPPFIFQGAVLGIVTIIGLLNFGGRIFDAITDPIIAGVSDRSKSKLGRRRKFLLISALPTAILSFLVFFPPQSGITGFNAVWVALMLLLFYLFITMYVTPYFALMGELGHTTKERLFLSTLISITWALGYMVGNQIYALQTIFEGMNMSSVTSFQLVIGIFAVVSFIFMMLPVIFIDEKRYCESHVSKEGSFEALVSAFKNKNFLFFTLSDFFYWVAITFIQIGIVYYITILLGFSKDRTTLFMTIMFLASFILYVPVNLIAQKTGKKKLLIIGFIIFSIGYAYTSLLGKIPFIGNELQAYILVLIMAIPLAIFGILPNAIVGDIAEEDGIRTNNYKAGVFFGARTFMQKLGVSVTNLIFPSLLLLGRSVDNDTGVRLSGVAALVFAILGLLLFLKYKEKDILKVLAKKEDLSSVEKEIIEKE